MRRFGGRPYKSDRSNTPKLILGFGALILLALAGLTIWLDWPTVGIPEGGVAGQRIKITAGAIYSARFADTEGNEQVLGQWQHQLLILNFWATWCAPCKEEMPMLARTQQNLGHKGVQIVGIGVDSRENVVKFAQKYPVGYPLLPDEARAVEFSRRLGNHLGLLPFTVAIRPGGDVVYTRIGRVPQAELVNIIDENTLK